MYTSSFQNSRTENTIRNLFFGVINKVFSIIVPFVVQTILIRRLGAEYLGINSLFASILQVLNVTELGFSSAILFSMYEPVANNNKEKIIERVSLYKTIYRIIGLFILTVGCIIIPFLPRFIKGSYPSDINIYVIYFLYLINTVISYLVFGYKNSILIVYQRNDLVSKIQTIVSVVKGLVQIISLSLFRNYYIYTIIIPLTTLLSNLMVGFLSDRYYPELSKDVGYSFKGLKEISKQVEGIAIGRISLVCRNAFDSIILSSLYGLIPTAIYSNYYLIFSSIGSFMSIILSSMSASVGNSLVTETAEKNEKDHIKYDFYYEMISVFCTICLYCLYQPFMFVWAGKELMFSEFTMTLFCLYFYINQLAQVRSVYSEAAGLWWHFRYLSIFEMAMNLMLNFILGRHYGANGILISTIITAFVFSFVCCSDITYRKLFKQSPKMFFVNNIRYFIICVFGCLCLRFITGFFVADNWLFLILKAFFVGSFALVYVLFFLMIKRDTRNELFMLFKLAMKKMQIGKK